MDGVFPLQMVREKSRAFQIPYQNMLIGCAKERLLERFLKNQEDSLKEIAVFYGAAGLGIEHYRHSKKQNLYVKVLTDTLDFSLAKQIGENFVTGLNQEPWETQWINRSENRYVLEVGVPFEKVHVPIKVELEASAARKGSMQFMTLPLCYENDARIDIPCFFPEAELAIRFVSIWKKMELTCDVSQFEEIYQLGKSFQLNGRKLSEYLEQIFRSEGLVLTPEQSNQVFACKDSTFLKKRWKAYLSKEKRTTPSWEEVIGLFTGIYEPVLKVMCKGEIFFGDWMPMVCRYL